MTSKSSFSRSLTLCGLGVALCGACSMRTPPAPAVASQPAAPAAEKHPTPPTVASGAKLVEVYGDDRFFEGPTWDPKSGKLLFTAFKGQSTQILRLDGPGKVSVWMDNTEGVNGTYRSKNGRLLGAQAFGHNLLSMRMGADGPEDVRSLTKSFEGKPYIQPNDVAESPTTGGIYYTDPDFGGKTKSSVFHLDAEGTVRRIITHLKVPNGLEVSNDGKMLVVGDSFEKRIYAYPIQANGTVDQGKASVFFDPDTRDQSDPDGMCTDGEGNFYFTMRGGVWVTSPTGKSLGLIPVPEFCSNVTFGGKDGKTLYMTCSKKVYSLAMNVKGFQVD